jgi:hypothetical protein
MPSRTSEGGSGTAAAASDVELEKLSVPGAELPEVKENVKTFVSVYGAAYGPTGVEVAVIPLDDRVDVCPVTGGPPLGVNTEKFAVELSSPE